MLVSSCSESSQDNMQTVGANLEEIALKTTMLCCYARNPFTSFQVKAITSKDALKCICQVNGPVTSQAVSEVRGQQKLPHGYGSLKTVTGRLLYRGDWFRGKYLGQLSDWFRGIQG